MDLVRAVERNASELLLRMGAAGGGVQRDDAKVRWTIGGSPLDYHNAVVAADLTAEDADAVIAESRELMKAHAVPGCWHVGPSMRPSDLGDRLRHERSHVPSCDVPTASRQGALKQVDGPARSPCGGTPAGVVQASHGLLPAAIIATDQVSGLPGQAPFVS